MIIKKLDYWKEDMNLTRPYAITYVMHDRVENIFIKITCDDDIIGLGAGSPSKYVTGEMIDTDFHHKKDVLSEIVCGRDLRNFRSIIADLAVRLNDQPALLAALDMALYDAFCKYIKIPLSVYLGVKIKPLPTSITIGIKSIQETLDEGIEYVERGFKVIKLKIGTNFENDLERYLKLKEKIGNHIKIRVDANQGFTQEQLIEFIKKTNASPVEFFEQPFPPKQYDQLQKLPRSIRMNCAGDEDILQLNEAVRLAQEPLCYGIYNIKLMKCGGITEAIRIADVAKTKSIDLMWGCMDESRISISAGLLVAMSCSNTKYLDLDGSLDLANDIVSGGFDIIDGIMYPQSNLYGLGVTLK